MPILTNKICIPELGLEIDLDINAKTIHEGSSFENYNARAFYTNVIKENLKDYYADELNSRKAINACITLYHWQIGIFRMIKIKGWNFKRKYHLVVF